MIAAARQIKSKNANVQVLMYNPVFPVVTWYDYGWKLVSDNLSFSFQMRRGNRCLGTLLGPA